MSSSDLSSGGYPAVFSADSHAHRSPQIMSRGATNGNLSSGEYPQTKSASSTAGRPDKPKKRVRASTMRMVEKLARETKTSKNHLKTGTRTYRSKEYDDCFCGCELVDWIVAERKFGRKEARRLACMMVEHSIICRAEPSLYHTFKDSTALFMFQASHGVVSVRIDEVKDFLAPDPLASPAATSSSPARKRTPKIRIEFRDQIVSCDPFATKADDSSASKKSPMGHHRNESTSSNSSVTSAAAGGLPTSPPVLSPQNSLSSLPSSMPSSPTASGRKSTIERSSRSSRSRNSSSPIGTSFFFAVKGQRDSITIRTMNTRNGDGILRIPSSEFNKGLQWFQFTPRASKSNAPEGSSAEVMPRIHLELFYTPRLGNGYGDNSVTEYILECAQQHRQKGTPHSSNTFTKGQYAQMTGGGRDHSTSLTLPGTTCRSPSRRSASTDEHSSPSRSNSRSARNERSRSDARRQKTSKRSSSKRASDGKKGSRNLDRSTSIARKIHRRTGSAEGGKLAAFGLRAASINFRRKRRGSITHGAASANLDESSPELLSALRASGSGSDPPPPATSNGKSGGSSNRLETFDALKLRSRSVTMPRGKRKNRRKSAENVDEAQTAAAAVGQTSPSLSSKSVGGGGGRHGSDELSLDDILNDPVLQAHKRASRRNSDGRNRRSSAFVGPGTIGITKGGRAAALRAMFNAASPRGDDQKHRSLGRTRRSQAKHDDMAAFDTLRNRRRMGIPDLPEELREDINSLRTGPEFPTTPNRGLGSGSFFRRPARKRGKSVMSRRRSLSNSSEQNVKEESLSQDAEEHSEAMQSFVEQNSRKKPLGFLRQKSFGTRETLGYTSTPISSPLLVLKNGSSLAVKNFVKVQEFMNTATPYEERIQLADQIVDLGLKKEEIRDEILFQIYKQTTGNPIIAHTVLGFKLFAICLTRFQPSDELQEILWQFFQGKCAEEHTDETEELIFMAGVCDWILTSWHNEKHSPVEELSLDQLDDFCEALYSPARFAYSSSVAFQILAAKKHGGLVDGILPIVRVLCQAVHDLDGKNVKGIFRVSSSRVDAQACRKELESTEALSEVKFPNAATAADLLKVWLRYLSIPLIPYEFHERCFELSEGTPKEAFDYVKESISPSSYKIMAFMMRFFADLSQYSDVTAMGVSNIAIVIAPNILRSRNDQASIAAAMEKTPLLLKFIEKVIIAFRDGIADEAEQKDTDEAEQKDTDKAAQKDTDETEHEDTDKAEQKEEVDPASESEPESESSGKQEDEAGEEAGEEARDAPSTSRSDETEDETKMSDCGSVSESVRSVSANGSVSESVSASVEHSASSTEVEAAS